MTFRASDNAVFVSQRQDIAEAAVEGALAHLAEPQSARRPSALVVAGAGALLFGCFGTAYAIPVFFPVLHRNLTIPLPHLTALFSAAGALYFSLGVMSGPLADRIGARIVAAAGCGVLAGGLVVMSRAGNEPVFDIGYLFGVGVCDPTPPPPIAHTRRHSLRHAHARDQQQNDENGDAGEHRMRGHHLQDEHSPSGPLPRSAPAQHVGALSASFPLNTGTIEQSC